jgi:hypothetical protein
LSTKPKAKWGEILLDTLERLSLVDDDAEWEEVPTKLPQEFFSHVSVVYKSEVIGSESGLFASRDI